MPHELAIQCADDGDEVRDALIADDCGVAGDFGKGNVAHSAEPDRPARAQDAERVVKLGVNWMQRRALGQRLNLESLPCYLLEPLGLPGVAQFPSQLFFNTALVASTAPTVNKAASSLARTTNWRSIATLVRSQSAFSLL